LSYVEVAVRLEQALGRLPRDWPTTPIRDLRPPRPAGRPRVRTWLETGVAVRALAIVLIVGTHAELFAISGGAHLLLGAVGFNLARFHLTDAPRTERLRAVLRALGGIVLVSVAWIAAMALLTGDYGLRQVLLLHYLTGPRVNNHYWFIEAMTYIVLVICALLAIPAVDRFERRHPFALPMLLAVVCLVARYQLVPGVQFRTPAAAAWLVALGWAIARADTTRQRILVSLVVLLTVPGFFNSGPRDTVVMAGLLLLAWVPRVPSTRTLTRVAGVLAGASLYVYLVHWQVYPRLFGTSALLATVASLAAGILAHALLRRGRRWWRTRRAKTGTTKVD
jgi:hypothetical protein